MSHPTSSLSSSHHQLSRPGDAAVVPPPPSKQRRGDGGGSLRPTTASTAAAADNNIPSASAPASSTATTTEPSFPVVIPTKLRNLSSAGTTTSSNKRARQQQQQQHQQHFAAGGGCIAGGRILASGVGPSSALSSSSNPSFVEPYWGTAANVNAVEEETSSRRSSHGSHPRPHVPTMTKRRPVTGRPHYQCARTTYERTVAPLFKKDDEQQEQQNDGGGGVEMTKTTGEGAALALVAAVTARTASNRDDRRLRVTSMQQKPLMQQQERFYWNRSTEDGINSTQATTTRAANEGAATTTTAAQLVQQLMLSQQYEYRDGAALTSSDERMMSTLEALLRRQQQELQRQQQQHSTDGSYYGGSTIVGARPTAEAATMSAPTMLNVPIGVRNATTATASHVRHSITADDGTRPGQLLTPRKSSPAALPSDFVPSKTDIVLELCSEAAATSFTSTSSSTMSSASTTATSSKAPANACRMVRAPPSFEATLNRHLLAYIESSRQSRSLLVDHVLAIVERAGGLFCRYDKLCNRWIQVGYRVSFDFCAHELKAGAKDALQRVQLLRKLERQQQQQEQQRQVQQQLQQQESSVEDAKEPQSSPSDCSSLGTALRVPSADDQEPPPPHLENVPRQQASGDAASDRSEAAFEESERPTSQPKLAHSASSSDSMSIKTEFQSPPDPVGLRELKLQTKFKRPKRKLPPTTTGSDAAGCESASTSARPTHPIARRITNEQESGAPSSST